MNEIVRSVLIKQNNKINAGQPCQHQSPAVFIINGPIRGFTKPTDRSIGIESQYQNIAQIACLAEVIHVARVQDVETPVGKNNGLPRTLHRGHNSGGLFALTLLIPQLLMKRHFFFGYKSVMQ